MNVGAENRTKVILVAVLGVAAIILFARMLWLMGGNPTPAASAPTRSAPTPQVRSAGRAAAAAPVAAPSLDPQLRLGLLEASEGTVYEGKGRNIFVPAPEPIPQAVASATLPPEPPKVIQPPPPPPINLKFFGFASHAGEPKRIFLAQGEDVFIGSEGDIVDRRYRIVRINPTSVEIEDVLNNNKQTIPLTQS
jgi:hypothetical protein